MNKPAKTILIRLLADVDDSMELVGTAFKSKDGASKEVTEALEKAMADLRVGLLAELPQKDDRAYADQKLRNPDEWTLEVQTYAQGYNAGVAACIESIERYFGGKNGL